MYCAQCGNLGCVANRHRPPLSFTSYYRSRCLNPSALVTFCLLATFVVSPQPYGNRAGKQKVHSSCVLNSLRGVLHYWPRDGRGCWLGTGASACNSAAALSPKYSSQEQIDNGVLLHTISDDRSKKRLGVFVPPRRDVLLRSNIQLRFEVIIPARLIWAL